MNLLNRFIFFCSRLQKVKKERGYLFTARFIVNTIYYKLVRIFVFPLAIFITCLRPWIKIRVIPVSCLTIGHYSLSIEVLLSKLDQDKNNKCKETIIYLQRPKSEVCNVQLYKMWKRVIPFPPDALYAVFNHLELYLEHWFGVHPYKTLLGQASHDRWDVLERGKQHLHFTKNELLQGETTLREMGIPANSPFICLIARDDAYYVGDASYTDMSAYRNADISTYKKAVLFLANNGYFVIRMGKSVNKAFDVDHDKAIDYACSHFRSDFMDIYLSAHCYFFMSTLCGLDGIAHAFRRPILATNITPHAYYHLGYPIKLFLSKKVIDKKTRKIITFKKQRAIFNLGSHHHFIHQRLNEHSLAFIDNTEDEILEATKEMLLRVQGNWHETKDSETLQKKFWFEMSEERVNRNHKGTKAMPICKYQPRYCRVDLLNNRMLLEDEKLVDV